MVIIEALMGVSVIVAGSVLSLIAKRALVRKWSRKSKSAKGS